MSAVDVLAGRIRRALGRAVLALVKDAAGLQVVQVQAQAGVVRDRCEHFQHYGLTSVAHPGAEGIYLALGASTDHMVVLNIDDRRYRLQGLESGEVALYDDLGHTVHLTREGIVVDGAGHLVRLVNLPKLRVEGDIEATGQIKDLCDAGGKTMAQMRTIYNGHGHPETDSITGTPNAGM